MIFSVHRITCVLNYPFLCVFSCAGKGGHAVMVLNTVLAQLMVRAWSAAHGGGS
jgi:hypothetical protein